MRRQVEEEFAAVKALGIDPPAAELARITAMFAPPAFDTARPGGIDRSDPDFAVWIDQNVRPHQQAEPRDRDDQPEARQGAFRAMRSADQIDVMANLAERFSVNELRVTHSQNIVLPHVHERDLRDLWAALAAAGLAEPNLDLISDIIACPGLDYCSLANARSIPVAQKIAGALRRSPGRQRDLGELKLKVSGCINACGHHHAGHIGILGVDKKGTENYQLLLGGSAAEDVSLGRITGPGFSEDGIVDAIERVTDKYLVVREDGERFLDTYRRVGFDQFKEAIYG